MTDRPSRVAGHQFDDYGNCVLPVLGTTDVCPIKWSWIRHCTDDSCSGMKGISHVGQLNTDEIAQIRREVAWLADRYMVATREGGGGGTE